MKYRAESARIFKGIRTFILETLQAKSLIYLGIKSIRSLNFTFKVKYRAESARIFKGIWTFILETLQFRALIYVGIKTLDA